MGDMADWVNDSWDHWGYYDDPYDPDDDLVEEYDYRSSLFKESAFTVTCRCCGTSQLIWRKIPTGRWLLHDQDGKLHNCPVNPIHL